MDEKKTAQPDQYWWRARDGRDEPSCAAEAQPGDRCPACGQARLAYDGLFVLACPRCGHVAGHGAFT